MARRAFLYVALSSGIVVAGCETTMSGPTSSKATSSEAATAEATGELRSDEGYVATPLRQSTLPPGKCGMVLWTLEQDRPSPVFRLVAGGDAEMSINGEPVAFTSHSASGAVIYGVAEEQAFRSIETPRGQVDPFNLHVSVKFGLEFSSGVYLQEGLLTLDAPDGWRMVTPAAGIAGCRRGG